MGILDPLMMSVAVMKYSREEVVDYLARAISRFARREYIMFTHNPGNHCIPPGQPSFFEICYISTIAHL